MSSQRSNQSEKFHCQFEEAFRSVTRYLKKKCCSLVTRVYFANNIFLISGCGITSAETIVFVKSYIRSKIQKDTLRYIMWCDDCQNHT